MRTLALALWLLAGCAHVTAQSWCEHFCGDRQATATESSEHAVSIATCTCRSWVKEQFDLEVERDIRPPSPGGARPRR